MFSPVLGHKFQVTYDDDVSITQEKGTRGVKWEGKGERW